MTPDPPYLVNVTERVKIEFDGRDPQNANLSRFEDGFLMDLKRLREFKASDIKSLIKIQSKTFDGVRERLWAVRIESNPSLTGIDGGTFHAMTSLIRLCIADNPHLEKIIEDTFQGLNALEHLLLNNNSLREITPRIYACRSLKWLCLKDNFLTEIKPGNVTHHAKLQIINLSGNKLKDVTFPSLPSLTRLALDHNSLEQIKPGTFGHSALLGIQLCPNHPA